PYLPNPAPGPITEAMPCFETAPPSPPPSLANSSSYNSLPAGLPNAWSIQKPAPDPLTFYGSLGYMALERQRLGHGTAAVLDTASGGIDTGALPAADAPEAADFHDIQPRFNHGVRATLGFHWDGQAIELSGFYLSQNSASKSYANPGQLSTFFNVGGDPARAPLGFEGDNGLWLQADAIKLQVQTALGSAEANYRCYPGFDADFS